MKPVIRLLAIFAIIFIVVNYVFKIFGVLGKATGVSNKPVDENRNVNISFEDDPKIGSNKGDYIDYEEVKD